MLIYISPVVHVIDVSDVSSHYSSTNLVVATDTLVESTTARIAAFHRDPGKDSETGIKLVLCFTREITLTLSCIFPTPSPPVWNRDLMVWLRLFAT